MAGNSKRRYHSVDLRVMCLSSKVDRSNAYDANNSTNVPVVNLHTLHVRHMFHRRVSHKSELK